MDNPVDKDLTAGSEADDLRRLDKLSQLLDNALAIPGTRFRIGLDGIIGLIRGSATPPAPCSPSMSSPRPLASVSPSAPSSAWSVTLPWRLWSAPYPLWGISSILSGRPIQKIWHCSGGTGHQPLRKPGPPVCLATEVSYDFSQPKMRVEGAPKELLKCVTHKRPARRPVALAYSRHGSRTSQCT